MGRVFLGWLALILAVPLAMIAGFFWLPLATGWTGSVAVGVLAATGFVLITAHALARAGLGWLRRDGRKPWQVSIGLSALALLISGGMAWIMLFSPGPEPTPYPGAEAFDFLERDDGSAIAYRAHLAPGSNGQPPVILVHGGPGAPGGWPGEFIDALNAAGIDVIDYHQVGSGLSSRLADPSHYTVARHIADLDALRSHFSTDTIRPVGVSWGAHLVARYMAAHPEAMDRAAFLAPAPIWFPAFDGSNRFAPEAGAAQDDVIARFPRIIIGAILAEISGAYAASLLLPDHRVDGVYQAMVSALDMRSGCPAPTSAPLQSSQGGPAGFGYWANIMSSRDAERTDDPRPALRELSTPILVVRGECDYIAPQVAGEYIDIFADADLAIIPNAGHTVASEQPELIAEQLASFFTR